MWHVATKHPGKTVRCVSKRTSRKSQATQDPLDLQAHHQRPEGTVDGWWLRRLPGCYNVDGNQKSGKLTSWGKGSWNPMIYKCFFSYHGGCWGFRPQYGKLSHDFQGYIHVKVVVWDFWTINSTTCWFFWIPGVLFLVVLEKENIFFSEWRDDTQFLFGGMIFWIWKSNYISSQQVWMCDEYLPSQTIASLKSVSNWSWPEIPRV